MGSHPGSLSYLHVLRDIGKWFNSTVFH